MDVGSDSSDEELEALKFSSQTSIEPGISLKPQMDAIFAEVEKSLPSIDFDLSDMSSDNDEQPVIFHRHLKMSELDYDNEKDLDTSLSGDSAADFFKSHSSIINIPSVDKNNTSLSSSPTWAFDNDLAALIKGWEDKDGVSSWHDLERVALQDRLSQQAQDSNKQQSQDRPSASPPAPTPAAVLQADSNLSNCAVSGVVDAEPHIGNSLLEAGTLLLAQLAENDRAGWSRTGGRTVCLNSVHYRGMESVEESTSNTKGRETCCGDNKKEEKDQGSLAPHGQADGGGDRNIDAEGTGGRRQRQVDSNREEERKQEAARQKELRRKLELDKHRRWEKDLALMYMAPNAPQLPLDLLDSIDLDSTLNNENDAMASWTPPAEFHTRITNRHAALAAEIAQNDREMEKLTLIEKLARFSSSQVGKDYVPILVDPQTGARLDIPSPPTQSTGSSTASASTGSAASTFSNTAVRQTVKVKSVSSCGTSTNNNQEKSSQPGCVTTPNARMSAVAFMETVNKRKSEPATVYLDLRGFEQHQKEEQERMASVSRVLGLEQQNLNQENDQSDSEDEEHWIKERQKIKHNISFRSTNTVQQRAYNERSGHTQPARVIPLTSQKQTQPKPTAKTKSSSGVSTSSCGITAALGTQDGATLGNLGSRVTEISRVTDGSTTNDSNLVEEERATHLAKEKEKEKLKEAARIAREEKEKIRTARLRMQHHLEGMRPTASVSETKPCAENTPVLFDLEASYEPRPQVLPSSLDKEEVLLITVNLSSNGEIALHNSRPGRTSAENTVNSLPKSYLSLLCWLVSLIPPDFNELKRWLAAPEEGAGKYPEDFPPFQVIGLQQLLVEGGLVLAVAVCPSPLYMLQKDCRPDRFLKKAKKGEETSRFCRFVDTYLSRHSLSSILCWPRYIGQSLAEEEEPSEYEIPLTFSNSFLPFLGKPMSAYMQIHKEPGAMQNIFNKDVGFFWQTVDVTDNVYQHGWKAVGEENPPQNTMFLISKQALFRPQVVHEALIRVISQSLDVSGLRLLYPASNKPSDKLAPTAFSSDASALSLPLSVPEGVTPVLAVAVRGPHARIRLVSIIGPTDYNLAKRTDPTSLMAAFGSPKSGLQIFCPRNAERSATELTRWFGGRVIEKGSMEVGLPYRLYDTDRCCSPAPGSGKGKKGKKSTSNGLEPVLRDQVCRPPAALTATTLSHIILVISPIVPVAVLGFLVSLMQQKAAFQPRGIRRVCLSVKKANTLGIPSSCHALFCPGVDLDVADIDNVSQHQESCSPSCLLILERENAAYHAASLSMILAMELRTEMLEEWMNDRTALSSRFDLPDLFHVTEYADSLLPALGGNLSRCPNFDPMCDFHGPMQSVTSNKELEQVVVLILLGKDLIKDWGSFLRKLQTFSTTHSCVSDFELLGVKWLPGMNSFQTREVTPYEIGDSRWRSSVHYLANEAAVVFALRGVNAYNKLEPFVSLPVNTPTTTIPASPPSVALTPKDAPHPTRIMSRTPIESYMFLRLFFWPHELFPDPDCRNLLMYLPESRLYFDVLEWNDNGNNEDYKPHLVLKTIEDQNLTLESIPDQLLSESVPLTTLLLIKPRAIQKHVPKILRRLYHEGFTIAAARLEVMEASLTHRFLASDFENGGEMYQLHFEYLTSGPSLYLAVRRENAVKKLRDLLGPEDPMQARRQSQFYWRGIYGTDLIHNGLYASRSYVEAVWDLKNCFPDGLCTQPDVVLEMEEIPCPGLDSIINENYAKVRHAVKRSESEQVKHGETAMEQRAHSLLMQTTCLVLPPLLLETSHKGKEAPFLDIINLLLGRGFELVGARMVWLTQPQAEQFLHILHGDNYHTVQRLTNGASLVLALQRDNAVTAFDSTLGVSEEAQAVLSQYGKDIFRPSDLKQASQLLALLFDHLTAGSQMDVKPLSATTTTTPPASPPPPATPPASLDDVTLQLPG